MEKGLLEKTGKSLDHWIKIVKQSKIEKHLEIINFLKAEHGLSYGFANFVALKAKITDAASIADTDLLSIQYKGKEELKSIYEKLVAEIKKFGSDITVTPKKIKIEKQRTLIQNQNEELAHSFQRQSMLLSEIHIR